MIFLRFLKNKRGETIAETLVSTLIAALSMVMFASMVIAANSIVTESDKKVREYYENSSKLISKPVDISTDAWHGKLYVNANGVSYYENE